MTKVDVDDDDDSNVMMMIVEMMVLTWSIDRGSLARFSWMTIIIIIIT